MRNQDELKAAVAKELKAAGLDVNVRIFKKKTIASCIRVTNRRAKDWNDKAGFFTPEEVEKLLAICEKFDLRMPCGYKLTDKNDAARWPLQRDFARWDWGNQFSIFWWIYS